MTDSNWIFEDYISPRALPNEQILAWIKWDSDISYDKILIKSDPDIYFQRILNVDQSVFDGTKSEGFDAQFENGTVVIKKDIIQVPGFVGFRAIYKLKPEDEKKLPFLIEFISNDKVINSIELSTTLVRPKLIMTSAPSEGIVVDDLVPILPSLSFTLKNMGHCEVQKLKPILDVRSWNTKDMKIEVKHTKEKNFSEEHLFVNTTTTYIPKIILHGSGMGMIGIGFQYYDQMDNIYETELVNVPMHIPQKENLEIPVSSTISNKQTLLLEPKLV